MVHTYDLLDWRMIGGGRKRIREIYRTHSACCCNWSFGVLPCCCSFCGGEEHARAQCVCCGLHQNPFCRSPALLLPSTHPTTFFSTYLYNLLESLLLAMEAQLQLFFFTVAPSSLPLPRLSFTLIPLTPFGAYLPSRHHYCPTNMVNSPLRARVAPSIVSCLSCICTHSSA